MNALNRLTTKIFDVLLAPFELMGVELALILVSGLFGIVALLIFKQVSWQKGIKSVKDRIKGDMIAIRIYQDDLAVVGGSVVKVFLRNFQYLSLNFLPILPLMAPFVLVMAQLAVRYSFAPIPVTDPAAAAAMLAGEGTMIDVAMKPGREAEVAGMRMHLPIGLKAMSPLVRNEVDGIAMQEVIATQAGELEIELEFPDGRRAVKRIVTGDDPARTMQPERVAGFWLAWLWPAEDRFDADSPVAHVKFTYPDRELRFLPDGLGAVIIIFFVASMVFGAAVLKPLGIQI